ncbi:MAG: glycosyltransferase [Bacteroidales bacterium]|nr:glycosyltransferase [Bacteroidales bacterium]
MKRVYISVINDLATDQRVHRVAKLLAGEGVEVSCIGRRLRHSPEPEEAPFQIARFRMLFTRGPLFYACYNLRLWLKLLFARKPDLLISNDLDTLPACYMVSRIRRVPLIYDSHELFTQMPELIRRKRVQTIWKWIERRLVPRVKFAVTVSYSIATIYRRLYGTRFRVVRNVPESLDCSLRESISDGKQGVHIIIYQGALNVGRGLELMIDAMQYVEDARFVIAGTGDIDNELKRRVEQRGVDDRVEFRGRLLPGELTPLTMLADLGISLEEDRGLNYRYALPNKLFDYIQCRVPVLCSSLPEMARIVESYGVGISTGERDPEKLAGIIRYMLKERSAGSWKEALDRAAEELCWEKESIAYLDLLKECGVISHQ